MAGKPDRLWQLQGMALYRCSLRGRVAFVAVDVDVASEAPIKGLGFIHAVRVILHDIHENGLPTKGQFAGIYDIEDALTGLLFDLQGYRYVGRVMTAGYCEFYFYGQGRTFPRETQVRIMSRFSDYQFCGEDGDFDPQWNKYFDCLYPNEMAYHYVVLQRTLDDALQRCQAPMDPVAIRHVLYFPTEESRVKFADRMAAANMTTTSPSHAPIGDRYQLVVGQTALVDLDTIYDLCERLIADARPLNGRYVYCEIDWSEIQYGHLSKHTQLTIAMEALAGLRRHESLKRFGLSVGEGVRTKPQPVKATATPGQDGSTSLERHLARSAAVLSVLRDKGVSLEEPRPIDIYFWCPSADSAKAVTASLTRMAFTQVATSDPSEAEEGGKKPLWSAQGTVLASPLVVASEDFTRALLALASEHGAELDGWGTHC